jgi:hypothetical protein
MTLDIEIPSGASDTPVPAEVRKRAVPLDRQPPPLRLGRTLSHELVTLVTGMLGRTMPTVDRVAAAAGTSGRTLRRALEQEGTGFSKLVERACAMVALRRLGEESPVALNELARDSSPPSRTG